MRAPPKSPSARAGGQLGASPRLPPAPPPSGRPCTHALLRPPPPPPPGGELVRLRSRDAGFVRALLGSWAANSVSKEGTDLLSPRRPWRAAARLRTRTAADNPRTRHVAGRSRNSTLWSIGVGIEGHPARAHAHLLSTTRSSIDTFFFHLPSLSPQPLRPFRPSLPPAMKFTTLAVAALCLTGAAGESEWGNWRARACREHKQRACSFRRCRRCPPPLAPLSTSSHSPPPSPLSPLHTSGVFADDGANALDAMLSTSKVRNGKDERDEGGFWRTARPAKRAKRGGGARPPPPPPPAPSPLTLAPSLPPPPPPPVIRPPPPAPATRT